MNTASNSRRQRPGILVYPLLKADTDRLVGR
jgi:hypothetical protein